MVIMKEFEIKDLPDSPERHRERFIEKCAKAKMKRGDEQSMTEIVKVRKKKKKQIMETQQLERLEELCLLFLGV